jgi:hypothetical protein
MNSLALALCVNVSYVDHERAKQSFISVYRVYPASIDILMWICQSHKVRVTLRLAV